jgi:nucleoid-associated protein YgaU
VIVPKILTTTVAQGDSLWRISRDTYGAGERYRVIFGANRKQIHNPNLIYPGQIFVLPAR